MLEKADWQPQIVAGDFRTIKIVATEICCMTLDKLSAHYHIRPQNIQLELRSVTNRSDTDTRALPRFLRLILRFRSVPTATTANPFIEASPLQHQLCHLQLNNERRQPHTPALARCQPRSLQVRNVPHVPNRLDVLLRHQSTEPLFGRRLLANVGTKP